MALLNNCWVGFFPGDGSQYVTCGTHSDFNFAPTLNAFSFHAWFRSSSASVGGKIILARGTGGVIQYGVELKNSNIETTIGNQTFSDNADTLISIDVNDDSWHQVIVSVRTSPQQVAIYLDGQQLAIHNYTGTSVVATDLLIGGCRTTGVTGVTRPFDGYIDEVGIWNSALSNAEMIELWNGGYGLLLDDNSGAYVSGASLRGFWRLGDGATENAGTPSPTTTIEDVSGYGHNGTLVAPDPSLFYFQYDNLTFDVPGYPSCLVSSSSSLIATTPSFTVERTDQAAMIQYTGFRGNMYRSVLQCTSTEGVDNKIFVHEIGRPVVGSTIRNAVFRRVATIQDLATVPVDEPTSTFPKVYRTNRAELLAKQPSDLDTQWQEVQRQCMVLSLDMQYFGVPVIVNGQAVYSGGATGVITFRDRESFGAVLPTATVPEPQSSSSSSVAAPISSSSSSMTITYPVSSSSSGVVITSSSSAEPDPYAFSASIPLSAVSDAVTRLNDFGIKTLYTDLGFIRFGRDADPERTWDAMLRFSITIPRWALIESAYLYLFARSSEQEEDVVIRAHDIYGSPSYAPIGVFSGTADPLYPRSNTVWSGIAPITQYGFPITQPLDVTDMLQFFVDRGSHVSGDYFGLWLQELVSDAGARRDAIVAVGGLGPKLVVNYRTDRGSSSSAGA